jgi:hypothetical protein
MHAGRRLRLRARLLLLLALAAAATGCSRDGDGDGDGARESGGPEPGRYRAVLDVPGGELPVGLEIERDGAALALVLVNGPERTPPAPVAVTGDRLTATLPGGGTLSATVRGDELTGEVVLAGPQGQRQALPLRARRGEAWRFHAQPLTDNADVAGRWALGYGETAAAPTAVAESTQSFEQVVVRLRSGTGENWTLAGEIHGEELALSRFDGERALLLRGRLQEDGRLDGELWSAAAGARRFTATRDPDAALVGEPAAEAAPAATDEAPVGHPAVTPLPAPAAAPP